MLSSLPSDRVSNIININTREKEGGDQLGVPELRKEAMMSVCDVMVKEVSLLFPGSSGSEQMG